MGAGEARGEGAHLLEVNEGVVAVLPVRCHAARSTHLPAGAVRAVVLTGVVVGGPRSYKILDEGRGGHLLRAYSMPTGARSIAHVTAPEISGAAGWPKCPLKVPVARSAVHGEVVVKIEVAGAPHHA